MRMADSRESYEGTHRASMHRCEPLAAQAQSKDGDAVTDLLEESGRPGEVALAVRGARTGAQDDAVDMREDLVLE